MLHNKRDVEIFVYNLILEGKNSIEYLTESDKEIISSLLIESSAKHSAFEFITEADKHDELPYMLANYMRKKDPETAQTILDYMVNNAVKYSSNDIVELLVQQEEEYNFDSKYDYEC